MAIYISFGTSMGSDPLTNGMSNSTTFVDGNRLALVDDTGALSGLEISVNGGGAATTNGSSVDSNTSFENFSQTRVQNFWYLTTGAITLTIPNVPQSGEYSLEFVASRSGSGTPRLSRFTFGSDSQLLDGLGNLSNTVTLTQSLNEGDDLVFHFEYESGNFAYMNALRILTPSGSSKSLIVEQDEFEHGDTLTFTADGFDDPITSAKIIQGAAEIILTSVTETSATVPALSDGQNTVIAGQLCQLVVSDGEFTASADIDYLPVTGQGYVELFGILDFSEASFLYGLSAEEGDQFINPNSDLILLADGGISASTLSGTYTLYAIDASDAQPVLEMFTVTLAEDDSSEPDPDPVDPVDPDPVDPDPQDPDPEPESTDVERHYTINATLAEMPRAQAISIYQGDRLRITVNHSFNMTGKSMRVKFATSTGLPSTISADVINSDAVLTSEQTAQMGTTTKAWQLVLRQGSSEVVVADGTCLVKPRIRV